MNIRVYEKYVLFIIYFLLSIQNGFFDEKYSVFGMDAVSLLLSILLIFTFIYFIYIRRIKLDFIVVFFFIIFIYKFSISLVQSIPIKNAFIDIRTTLYFFIPYAIFKYNIFNDKDIIIMLKIGGLLNSALFLYFMGILMNEKGIGARDVTFNLYISLFSLAIILFIDKQRFKNILNIITALLNIFAIVLSQQRTIMIPLSIILVIFIISNIKAKIKNIISIIVIFIGMYCIYAYFKELGFIDILINRFSMENFTGESSTLGVRINATKEAFYNVKKFNFIFGCGFGSKYCELEMLLPNYIIKYGIIGSVFIISYIGTRILKRYKIFTELQKKIMFILIIMLIGGVISGFGGFSGQMLLAIILAIINQNRILNRR